MAKNWALVASFDTTADVYHAAEKIRDAGYKHWDVFTPFPIHGLDAAMGLKRSRVPVFTFLGGFAGFNLGMLIVWFANAFDYPLIVRGMPFFSFVYPFPVFYELTILLAAFGTLGGMFLLNRLPRHHHPLFDYSQAERLTDDAFAIAIEARDGEYDREKTRGLLASLGGRDISLLSEDGEEQPA